MYYHGWKDPVFKVPLWFCLSAIFWKYGLCPRPKGLQPKGLIILAVGSLVRSRALPTSETYPVLSKTRKGASLWSQNAHAETSATALSIIIELHSYIPGWGIPKSNAAQTVLLAQDWLSPTLAVIPWLPLYSVCPTLWTLVPGWFYPEPPFLESLWALLILSRPFSLESWSTCQRNLFNKRSLCVHNSHSEIPYDNTIMCDCNSLNSFSLFPATRVTNALICSWISVMLCHEVLELISLTVLISGLVVSAGPSPERAASSVPPDLCLSSEIW